MNNILRFIIFFLNIIAFQSSIAGDSVKISSVYVGSRGNNQYEAKIIAVDDGAKRAFILAIDKILLRTDKNLDSVSLKEIRDSISNIVIRNEQIQHFTIGAEYSSLIDYYFDQQKLNHLLLKYGSLETKEVFAEAVVIPIFRINKKIYIKPETTKFWVPEWFRYRLYLSQNKLILPDYNIVEKVINERTVNSLKFRDVLSVMPYKLFKKIIIASCEYFTDDKGKSYFDVTYTTIRNNKTNFQEIKRFIIDEETPNHSEIHQNIIKNFAEAYGRRENINYIRSANADIRKEILKIFAPDKVKEDNYYLFKIEIYNPIQIDSVILKLDQIPEITKYQVRNIDVINYEIKAYTTESLENLARIFYDIGLSYYKFGDNLVMLEIEK